MNKILISCFTPDTCTNASGDKLYGILKPYFEKNETVLVSFSNIQPMSSSFFNSSFGELIETYGADTFKRIVRLTDIPKNQVGLLKNYLRFHFEQ